MVLFFLTLTFLLYPASQSADSLPTITIQVRNAAGQPVGREEITLIALPAYEAVKPACFTDENGRCAWTVRRGMYEVKFASYGLDEISALAVSEGGLSSFGITVGDADITYPFTFWVDGHVYFDAAPDSAVPQPIIPTIADLGIAGGAVKAIATPIVLPSPTPGKNTIKPAVGVGLEAETTSIGQVLFALLLAGGVGVYAWRRRKKG